MEYHPVRVDAYCDALIKLFSEKTLFFQITKKAIKKFQFCLKAPSSSIRGRQYFAVVLFSFSI